MRARGRVDGNHEAIVDALRKTGWLVVSLADCGGGIPDLLAYRGGDLRLIEVKDVDGWLTPAQEAFQALGWPVTVVKSVDDVLSL